MSQRESQELTNQVIEIADLPVGESAQQKVNGGEGTIRVHYDTGFGNRIVIRG